MRRLMNSLTETGLYFLDSRTSSQTVAYRVARSLNVPTIARDVFLDHEITIEHIAAQYERALTIMQRRGYAVMSLPSAEADDILVAKGYNLDDLMFSPTVVAL